MTEDRQRIDVLRDDLDLESQRYEQAAGRLAATQSSDRHRMVEVRLGEDGGLEWVRVRERWRDHHDAAALGVAVLEAYHQAAGEHTRAWSELLVDDNWTGTAATAYKEQVPEQEGALRTIGQSFATAVDSAMGSLKTGIITFWAAIVTGLIGLALAIVAAMAAAGTVIGLPAAPVAVISGVVAFLLAAGTGVAALVLGCDSAADSFRNARQYATDWPDFAVG